MRLFPRLFLSHLAAIAVALVAVLVLGTALDRAALRDVAEVVAPASDRAAETDAWARALVEQQRRDLLLALVGAVPLAVVAAGLTAVVQSRRVAAVVATLAQASRRLADGRYAERVAAPRQGELTELADAVNDLAAVLEQVEHERLELVTVVAHELRTPSAALVAYAEALVDGVLDRDAAVRGVQREAAVIKRLTSDLLFAARVGAGALDLRPSAVDVAALLDEAVEPFETILDGRSVRVAIEVAPHLPAARADPERVRQVLANLVSNAARHVPDGGTIVLSAVATGDEVCVSVADSGAGIPKGLEGRVFERFYRIDAARSRDRGGVGIGLAVCRGLVAAMGGRIWVDADAGPGATLRFTLPRADASPARKTAH